MKKALFLFGILFLTFLGFAQVTLPKLEKSPRIDLAPVTNLSADYYNDTIFLTWDFPTTYQPVRETLSWSGDMFSQSGSYLQPDIYEDNAHRYDSLDLERATTVEEVNEAFRIACLEGNLIEQIRFSNNTEFVSSDGIGDSCACIFDAPATKVSEDGKTVILYLWYDNEFGYSNQVVRLARHIGQVKSYRYY